MNISQGLDIYFQPNVLIEERYRFDTPIKCTATHRIWKAHEIIKETEVIIKFFITTEKPPQEWKDFWMSQFEELQKITHPHLLLPFSTGNYLDSLYWVYPYIPEGPLSQIQDPLPSDQIAKFLLEIALALDFLHQRNQFHLDVTLDNIYWQDRKKFLLGDLGCGSSLITKPDYLPPEGSKKKDLDPYTDIYSLGVCAYYLSTLEFPKKNNEQNINSLKQHHIQPFIIELIVRCLDTNYQNRPTLKQILSTVQLHSMYSQAKQSRYEKWINIFAITSISIVIGSILWIVIPQVSNFNEKSDNSRIDKYREFYQKFLLSLQDKKFIDAAININQAVSNYQQSLEEEAEVCIQLVRHWDKDLCSPNTKFIVKYWLEYPGLINVLQKENKKVIRQYLRKREYPISYLQLQNLLIDWLDCLIKYNNIEEAKLLIDQMNSWGINHREINKRVQEIENIK
ncbi:MAG: protein kinase family protein [Bacteroidia bacterium]|nr:protein kinase family protein [Bacteroidia bacterium]